MTNGQQAETESQGIKDAIKLRLLEATDESSLKSVRMALKDDGYNAGSIDACVSELRKQGHLKFNSTAVAKTAKALPLEVLIEDLTLPDIVDGQRAIFDAGVKYGMNTMVIGIKMAQELSGMGISQAWPMLAMAKELRQGDNQALQAGNAAAERVLANVMPQLASLRASVNTPKVAPPPAAKNTDELLMRPISKIVDLMTNQMINKMFPGAANQQNPDWTYVDESAPAQPAAAPPPAQDKTKIASSWTEEVQEETNGESE